VLLSRPQFRTNYLPLTIHSVWYFIWESAVEKMIKRLAQSADVDGESGGCLHMVLQGGYRQILLLYAAFALLIVPIIKL
jgi:hypothetical protein